MRSIEDEGGLLLERRQDSLEAPHRFRGSLKRAKSTEAELPFTSRAEANPRRTNNLRVVQQIVEELPRIHATGALEPHVRGVVPTDGFDSASKQCVPDQRRIAQLVVKGFLDLHPTLRRVNRGCGLLHHVRCSIELR